MLEVVVSIILLPVAALAAVFTVALGAGVIKAIKNKQTKEPNKNLTE